MTAIAEPDTTADRHPALEGSTGSAMIVLEDVRAALVRAFADVKALPPEAAEQAVVTLEREKRYLQDTY